MLAAELERIRELRAERPDAIGTMLRGRRRRPLLEGDRRLMIVAADHPARGALGALGDPTAMASRTALLERLLIALERPGVDGVLGTPDVVEDLAALGALDGKVVFGSMNRGGLHGASFEIDDRYTGYDVPAMVRDGIDAAKLLLRIDLADASTPLALERAAQAVTDAAAARLPVLIEPFMSGRRDGRPVNDLSPDAVIASVAISSGLGASSAWTWLKLPVVPDMARVVDATTLPVLLLGGDPVESLEKTFGSWASALAQPGVRGLVVGRTLLHPADGDVAGAVDRAAALVHGAASTHPADGSHRPGRTRR